MEAGKNYEVYRSRHQRHLEVLVVVGKGSSSSLYEEWGKVS